MKFASLALISLAIAPSPAWAKSLPATAVYPPPDPSSCYYNYQQVPASLVSQCCENGLPKAGGTIPGCPPLDNPSGSQDQIYNGGAGSIISGTGQDLSDTGKMVSDTPVVQGDPLTDQSSALGGANVSGSSNTAGLGYGGTTKGGSGSGSGGSGGSTGGNSSGSMDAALTTPAASPSPSPGLTDKLIGDILSTVDSFVKGQSGGGAGTETGSAAGGVTLAGGVSEEGNGTDGDVKHSDDPANYFSLLKPDDNLFKIVTRRYIAKTKEWVLADNAALMPKAKSMLRK